ncbi:hypothetical protein AsAng_0021820 [Aureispira anguillae]|uniref:Uncharacterized protein n=1 Tax=Aureispira anguillae TaxID=2864201 RepID=A0A915YE66_9BACT|nr:hypothetical protein AsAng_0021820 [Aureispira anguillae]
MIYLHPFNKLVNDALGRVDTGIRKGVVRIVFYLNTPFLSNY